MKTLSVLVLALALTACSTQKGHSYYGKKGAKNYRNAMEFGKNQFQRENAGKCNRYH